MNYNLKFGEGKIIANECGVSTTTFKKAIKGEIDTPIAQLIRMHTETVIRQREERVEALNKLLSKINKGGRQ
jgi:hypothetical protein